MGTSFKFKRKMFVSCLVLLLSCICPTLSLAQSQEEFRVAMDRYDYETPIRGISAAAGDSVLTPLRAQALKAMGRYPEALKEWNSLMDKDSTKVKVLMEVAECYRLLGKSSQAATCYQKTMTLQPDNRFFHLQWIRSLLNAEAFSQARDACHNWIEKDSVSATGYKYLGMAYEGLAREDSLANFYAYVSYATAYERDSLDAQVVALLSSKCIDNRLFSDAVDYTEAYRRSDTTNIDVNRQNAKAYCMLQDYETAVARYEALKNLGDNSFTTYYYCGISYFGAKWSFGARTNLLEAHKKAPEDINVLYYLAKSCAYSGITKWREDGIEYMQKAIKLITPDDSVKIRFQETLVDCYSAASTKPYEYIEELKKLYSMTKKYTIFNRIAWVYDWQKDYANAIHYYEKYMSLVPENKRVALDENGEPFGRTMYETAKKRVQEIKAEGFFREGVPKKE